MKDNVEKLVEETIPDLNKDLENKTQYYTKHVVKSMAEIIHIQHEYIKNQWETEKTVEGLAYRCGVSEARDTLEETNRIAGKVIK